MHKLYCGDCHELIKTIPDQSVDLILVDEPYGSTKNTWDQCINPSIWADKRRVLKPNGSIIHFGTGVYIAKMISDNFKSYKHEYIWNKKQSGNFPVAKYQPLSVFEKVVVFSDDVESDTDNDPCVSVTVFTSNGEKVNYYPIMRTGKLRKRGGVNPKTNGQGFGGLPSVYYESDQYYPTNILDFPAVPRQHSLHPSQKPVALLEHLIKTYSTIGGTVLDYCMGVGSTVIAAQNTDRIGIGIELNESYYTIAENWTRKNDNCNLST